MENVTQRVAVVTGGNRGVGLAVANLLAQRGIHAVLGAPNAQECEAAVADLKARGLSAAWQVLDVTQDASVTAFADFVRREYGRLDILINNAGIVRDRKVPALEVSLDDFRETFEVNVVGALRMMQALMPIMKEAGSGRVVNVSSLSGSLSKMGGTTVAYRASKTALNALTRTLAAEHKEDDILINSVCPGWVRTEVGGDEAPRTPEEAAEGIFWAATLPVGGPTGGFFRDKEPLPW